MPYRRLPNTDLARIKALKAAIQKGDDIPPYKLAYKQNLYQKSKSFLIQFEQAKLHYNAALDQQSAKNEKYQDKVKKARLYISHFMQVMNMSIIRGEFKKDIRTYYGLKKDSKRVPCLKTEKDIIKWGKLIIEGETKRIREGGTPILNPTIAKVKVRYEIFLDHHNSQKVLQNNTSRAQENTSKLRDEADALICEIWNDVEEHFSQLRDARKREECKKYGIVYFYRKDEIKSFDVLSEEDTKVHEFQTKENQQFTSLLN